MKVRKREPKATKPKRGKKKRASRAHIEVTARDRAAGERFAKLVALQERLLAPDGCPWDREQTHQSLRKYLLEETYEVLDAMDSGDPGKFNEELGDLLLQIVFHAALAEKARRFGISDVIQSIHDKMVRRHPHVFGDEQADSSAAVLKNWEQIKAAERAAEKKGEVAPDRANGHGIQPESILSGVPRSLPGVLEAYQLTRRAAHIGFDWENLQGVLAKLEEEKREIEAALREHRKPRGGSAKLEEEVGDLLFAAVNVARFAGVDPEIALKKANAKFKSRFQWMESAAQGAGRKLANVPRDEMENLWDRSKAAERTRKSASE